MWSRFPNLLATLFMCLAISQAYAQGLGDWQHKTPGDNTMGNNGSGNFLQMQGDKNYLPDIKKWYFYKKCIIGGTDDSFFIADEEKNSIILFKEADIYAKYLSQNNLRPSIWTRWYSDNWSTTDFLNILLIFWFVSTPIILCFVWIFHTLLKVYFKFRFPTITLAFIAALVSLVTILSDEYPQSF